MSTSELLRVCVGDGDAVLLDIKAVPGAKRDQIVGPLGARLKVRISQPPEDGKANHAIRELFARELGLKVSAVSILRGHACAEKTVRIEGATADAVRALWV